ncbi:MAG: hypothetical protein FJX74_21820, partial [Armatimonadetes bacterium]|nr:hypothetical protein [Armatimonadota bacterium]
MARKLIWLSDSPALATGFGRVTRQVLPLLVERLACDVVCLGFGHPGTDDVLDQLGYQLLPQGAFGSPQDNLARVVAGREATVVTLGDAWDHGEVARAKVRHRFRWVAYVPVDSGPLPRKAVEALLVADAVLTPSHYGRSVLREALPELPVSVAYHGVDCGAFT